MYISEKIKSNGCLEYLDSLIKRILRVRILRFMFVGGIGYLINMGVYYPLTVFFKNQVTFLGQQFYLPPYIISSVVAITSNYFLNRIITFKDTQEENLGGLKFMSTYLVSLPIEMVIIFLLVQFSKLEPVIAAALAILIVFIGRYLTVKTIAWNSRSYEYKKMA